jgi:23S rRNA maturation mini-RNase III
MVAAVQVDRMSTTDLAYIGDVVYELFIRSHMIYPPRRTSELQGCVVAVVRAEYQAHILQSLLLLRNNNNGNDSNNASINASTNDSSSSSDSGSNSNYDDDDDDDDASSGMFVLTMEERRVVSRGRNAVSGGSKRRGRKNNSKSAAKDYQDATALEALIGHVYISNPLRCAQLLSYIRQEFLFSPSSRAVEKES